jgi:hypothetical protein
VGCRSSVILLATDVLVWFGEDHRCVGRWAAKLVDKVMQRDELAVATQSLIVSVKLD